MLFTVHTLHISVDSFLQPKGFPLSLSTSQSAMGSDSAPLLVLCGKSTPENEIAVSLKNNKSLKLPNNTQVSVVLHTEMDKLFAQESFCIDSFLNALSTNHFGRFLIWSPRLPSTHDVVSHNFSELPIGAPALLMCNSKGEMEDGRAVPLLQYVVSLAMTEAIKDVCDRKGLLYLDVKIKWPNDLYLHGQKVGGVLCTSTYSSKKFNISAGIGLNVDNDKPTTCLNAVLRELSAVDSRLRREDIVAAFFNKFENFFDLFINQGFQTLEELYYKTWLHSGQKVTVLEKNEDQVVETIVTIQGLTSSGYLLAIAEDNQMCQLHPDGNSFDFLQGLVKRKLD